MHLVLPTSHHYAMRAPPLRLLPRADVLMLRGGGVSLASLADSYGAALVAAPLATKCTSAAVIAVAADAIAQSLTASGKKWDWARTRWMVVWGAVVSGCGNALWFDFLNGLFPPPITSAAQLAKKVLVNQLFMAPALNSAFFTFVILTRMRPIARMTGDKWSALRQKCAADLVPTIMRGNIFWTTCQTLNFKLVPPSLMTLSTNFFSLVWTIYLSIVGNRAAAHAAEEERGR